MIGNCMTSEGQIFSQQEMSVAIKKIKENKAADESGVIAGLMNGILNGADIPKEWKENRVKLLHKGGRTDEWKNYRPIAIINITCKLCMLMVRERIDKWTEDSGMLGEIQGGFRRGRRTEDNLFMLERLIDMVKGRKEEIFVAFLDMEKAYDRVNRKKLFEVMRCYGVHEKLVRLIERFYDGSLMKFELEEVTTRWCKSDSGVRQGCPLSPLLFNIYVRELGNVISNCAHGVKYAVVGMDGVKEWKTQAGLLYADDVCLMANSEKHLKAIMEKVNECVVEYGLKVNEKKSKVVCINGKVGRRRWMMGDCCIGEIEEYKYLGITI